MRSARQAGTLNAAEFFAGIGLARLGLNEAGIEVPWSNDIAPAKYAMFQNQFGESIDHEYIVEDLANLGLEQLPVDMDIAWGSFPCTDLSVAGSRAGIHRGAASSAYWYFIKALSKMGDRRPPIVALENVTAFASSHSGRDIASAIRSLNGLGYSVDVLSIDARRFVAQSRPRLFLIGSVLPVESAAVPGALRPEWLTPLFEDSTLKTHQMWVPEAPALMSDGLADYVEMMDEDDSRWWSSDRVHAFVDSLSDLQLERLKVLRSGDASTFRTAYRRMRKGVPRWEIRSDGVAGCLRTASGGSSKQAIVMAGGGSLKVRWMSPKEYASLMGAPGFPIGNVSDNQAYSGFGDAVCVPVVAWLAKNYLLPMLDLVGEAAPARSLDTPRAPNTVPEIALDRLDRREMAGSSH